MRKRLTITAIFLLFCVMVYSLSNFTIRTEKVHTFSLSSTDQEAYDWLCISTAFSSGGIGSGGTAPYDIEAYIKLYRNKNAKEIFRRLEREATTEGKLYALCALFYLDYDYYYSVIDKYAASNESCNLRSG